MEVTSGEVCDCRASWTHMAKSELPGESWTGQRTLTTPLTPDSTWLVVKERLAIAGRSCSLLESPLWVGAACHLPVSCTGQMFALLFKFH